MPRSGPQTFFTSTRTPTDACEFRPTTIIFVAVSDSLIIWSMRGVSSAMSNVMGEGYSRFGENIAGIAPHVISRIGLEVPAGTYVTPRPASALCLGRERWAGDNILSTGAILDGMLLPSVDGTVRVFTSMLACDTTRSLNVAVGLSDVGVRDGMLATSCYVPAPDFVVLRESWATADILKTGSTSAFTLAPSVYETMQVPTSMLAADATKALTVSASRSDLGVPVGVLVSDVDARLCGSVVVRERWSTGDAVNSGPRFPGTGAPSVYGTAQAPASMLGSEAIRALAVPVCFSDVDFADRMLASDTYARLTDSVEVCKRWSTGDLAKVATFADAFVSSAFSTVQLAQHDLRLLGMIDRGATYWSPVRLRHDATMIPGHMPEGMAYGLAGVVFPSDMRPSPAVGPYRLDKNQALTTLLDRDRASFYEVVVPSWKDWSTGSDGSPHVGSRLADYLVDRVRGAVYEAVASHGTIGGDLTIQVVMVLQAQTGAITQIGRISSN